MESLLFLAHRIPFPPNKGDKIRSFNILKYLSQRYRIHLGFFIDDPHDFRYIDDLKPYCAEIFHQPLKKTTALVRGTRCFLTGQPLTLPYFYDSQLQAWVDTTVSTNKIDKAFLFSSSMAQYLDTPQAASMQRVIDFVDVDSNKWLQYADKKKLLLKWFFQREHRTLLNYEKRITEAFDAALFVSDEETAFFRDQIPAPLHNKVHSMKNGVDLEYFSPGATTAPPELPINASDKCLVFTGAMDYWANEDAVIWFADHVWDGILAAHPDCRFYIVGGSPTAKVQALSDRPGITVTGRVKDVRPYLQNSIAAIAPLQIARGIQNKVLEAMAMAKPVIATSLAMEGIGGPDSMAQSIQDTPADFTKAVLSLLATSAASTEGQLNRTWVETHFSWAQALAPTDRLLQSPVTDDATIKTVAAATVSDTETASDSKPA